MKKFIAAFDSLNFCESTMSFAIFLAKHSNAYLVGVFLEDFTRRSYGFAELAQYEGTNLDKYVSILDEKDEKKRGESIGKFDQACRNASLNYTVHRDRNVAIQEILEESIFADLLIVSAGETMTTRDEPVPTRFIRELLNDVQCPVVMVPKKYMRIDKIIFLYDGEPSSVHAVRTFSHTLGSIKELETEIVTVKTSDESVQLPNGRLMREFIKRHYPDSSFMVLHGDEVEEEIISYLVKQPVSPMLVLGAYRRSRLSRLFRPSMADKLIKELKAPLFIVPK